MQFEEEFAILKFKWRQWKWCHRSDVMLKAEATRLLATKLEAAAAEEPQTQLAEATKTAAAGQTLTSHQTPPR